MVLLKSVLLKKAMCKEKMFMLLWEKVELEDTLSLFL